jgi:rhodanese-related sulfurtransferase
LIRDSLKPYVKLIFKRRARKLRVKSEMAKSWGKGIVNGLLLVGLLFLFGCGNNPSTVGAINNVQNPTNANSSSQASQQGQDVQTLPTTASIDADALEEAIKSNPKLQLVDVREAREFASGHIKMAVNRPLAELEKEIIQLSKDKELVIIDLNGTRAVAAWQLLAKNGFDKNRIKVLSGGMMSWRGLTGSAGNNAGGGNGSTGEAPKAEVQEVKGGC